MRTLPRVSELFSRPPCITTDIQIIRLSPRQIVDNVIEQIAAEIEKDPYAGSATITSTSVDGDDLLEVRALFERIADQNGYRASRVTMKSGTTRFAIHWDTPVDQFLEIVSRTCLSREDLEKAFGLVVEIFRAPNHGKFVSEYPFHVWYVGMDLGEFQHENVNFATFLHRNGLRGFTARGAIHIYAD